MIYEVAEASSPISQGDIFTGIPFVQLPDDCLKVVVEGDKTLALKWEDFASNGADHSAVVGVRPVMAIVGSQDCDAIRAPDVTLFQIRPFRKVETKSSQTKEPKGWISILTQHSKVNQKWFYLPPDQLLAFEDKMAADLDVSIRVPRKVLDRLTGFRKGRLNETAKAHFRERVSEYFRRYSYDEWYALSAEEFAAYKKRNPEVEPYPWQK